MPALDHRPGTPAQALDELLAGNRRFVTGTRVHPHQDAEHRAAVALEQQPFAVVFGCSDSRLAAEIIFDRGLGDLFVVRTAGHVAGPEVTASIEYGVAVLGTPLVVVLGHDACGGIRAGRDALAGDQPDPRLAAIVDGVTPSIANAHTRGVTDQEGITRIHVERTVAAVARPGTATGDAVAAGRCAVVGMYYRLADGQVDVVGDVVGGAPVPRPRSGG
ncbi:carbonic anhydrase [Rugosimonospora africana]|uniref:carbonic anhydrase n=1 Tax=Rugosimonospora africana TaxID=556532 RepID=A0A8J3VQN9_9ACTN|nr:carbonic anhydrase [Rugosimonospora africana]GIH14533.1 carbonic anhydrase [Rugosimonospora africana]